MLGPEWNSGRKVDWPMTTDRILAPGRPAELLSALRELARYRAPAEVEIVAGATRRQREADERFEAAKAEIARRYEEQRSAIEDHYAAARQKVVAECDTALAALQQEYDAVRAEAAAQFEAAQAAAEQRLREAEFEAATIFEAAKGGTAMSLDELLAQIDARWAELVAIGQEAEALLRSRGLWRAAPPLPPAPAPPEDNPLGRLGQMIGAARGHLRRLADERLSESLDGIRPLLFVLLAWLASIYPAGLVVGWQSWHWAGLSALIALAVSTVVGSVVYVVARRRAAGPYAELRRTLAEAGLGTPGMLETIKQRCARTYSANLQRHNALLKQARQRFNHTISEIHLRKQDELQRANQTYPPRLAELTARRDRQLAEADQRRSEQLAELDRWRREELERVESEHARALDENHHRHQREWGELTARWTSGMEDFRAGIERMQRECDRLFPDFAEAVWADWEPPREYPPAVRVGRMRLGLARLPDGIPADERLCPPQTEFTLPLLLPFPDKSLLMFDAPGTGRAAAIEALRAIMLRLLVSNPPGKVRLTIFDPVGLGENFSAFMHLADFDDKLVGGRIWTESAQFDKRLADLTEHMENVLQLYLRNEFASIQEYNASAGEMAEPYRVLVVANFPANFSDNGARRLLSVVSSGARCGVYTLLALDRKLPMPRGFDLADLEAMAMTLRWDGREFAWRHADCGELPVELDRPPEHERFTELVRRVGQAGLNADRVEVSFSHVAPGNDEIWSADSRRGIDVPLGRAGAMKLQHLRLGEGTSQHVLIAGKTGSGKSTLLHVLATNVALRYGPDEVELYLIDFKKGVEFKAYAAAGLPHARVIAIESEREFGLSVLERLDEELRQRGDVFRRAGAQEIAAYRDANPTARMPRILLIVDEFQELFVEDDRIAQQAALLLDRLVRQGRAFGIHVLLGSQTLAGAYTLPRATIGQMAVRIALQCSDADAHLILSEENTAARLLGRPGEAIYNDANGLFEGNHPFQIAWLPEAEREALLAKINQVAEQRGARPAAPIVFEGNLPADPATNQPLGALIERDAWPPPAPAPAAWLGAAVAIKEPIAARFARQSGANLLVVGQHAEATLGVMAAALVSLAAQHPPCAESAGEGRFAGKGPGGARFVVLDGTRPDAPEAGLWRRVADALPHAVRVAGVREAATVIEELSAELARRAENRRDDDPPVFFWIHDLGRFRELRKADDDFGFRRGDGPASPAEQLSAILRDGPPLGLHALVWCDSYNNVNRWLDRQALRDFEMRVLFHLNATDSSNLIDSPAASRLGVHRAILYHDGEGWAEKFRPYGVPTAEWLRLVGQRLRRRRAGEASSG